MTEKQVVKEIQKQFKVNSIYARKIFLGLGKKIKTDSIEKFIQQKPKPFVKWVGGKRQLLDQFRELNLYPPEKFNPEKNSYFEPFVGGGAVFFDLLPKNAHLSDLNTELVTTYKVIKSNVEDLIRSLKKHVATKEYFLQMRSLDIAELTEVEIASRFIFLNRTCFNGLYRVNSKGQFNVPFGRYSNPIICDEENLRKVAKALTNVQISNKDYKFVLEKAKKNDFVYFDPPYYPLNKTSSFTSYTKEGFLEKEQKELCEVYTKLHKRGCFVMLSNSDTFFIKKLYKGIEGVRIHKVYASRAVNSNATQRGKITEILVTNY